MKQQTEGTLENNNLIIPANVNTLGSLSVGGYELLPAGCVIIWTKTEIPDGWIICDGDNETPDLRGRFVLGYGEGSGLTPRALNDKGPTESEDRNDPNYGVTKGGEQHQLQLTQMPEHSHTYQRADTQYDAGGRPWPANNNDVKMNNINTSIRGADKPHNNMPPYYVLIYIMKVY
jgi:microcystin-dependent protein